MKSAFGALSVSGGRKSSGSGGLKKQNDRGPSPDPEPLYLPALPWVPRSSSFAIRSIVFQVLVVIFLPNSFWSSFISSEVPRVAES